MGSSRNAAASTATQSGSSTPMIALRTAPMRWRLAIIQTNAPAVNTSPLYIGQFGGNTDRLDGIVDEVRIYNRALSQTEVQSDMNTPL